MNAKEYSSRSGQSSRQSSVHDRVNAKCEQVDGIR
jgi:hypothetical protein